MGIKESRFPVVYLMTGYHQNDNLVSGLSPLTNTVFIAEAPENAINEVKKPLVLRTDNTGKINALKGDGSLEVRQLFHAHKDRPIIIPPVDAVSYLAAAKGESWVDELIEIAKTYRPSETLRTAKIAKILPEQLEKPAKTPNSDEEKQYAEWHQNQTKPLYGYIVPKIRAVIVIVKRDLLLSESRRFSCIAPNGQEVDGVFEEVDDYYLGVISGTKKDLPNGLYRFEIVLNPGDLKFSRGNWNSLVNKRLDDGNPSYRLAEMVKFDITSPAGEFDIINGDPITVEESLMVQYPRFYSHLLVAAKDIQADKDNAKAKIGTEFREPAKGLMDYAKSVSVVRDKAKLASKLIQTDLSTYIDDEGNTYNGKKTIAWTVAKALHSHLETTEDKKVKAVLDSVFATKEGLDAWQDFRDARESYLRALSSDKGLQSWNSALKEKYYSMPKNTQADLEKYSRSIAGKVGIPKKGLDLFGRGMAYIDMFNGARAISDSAYSYVATVRPDFKKSKQDYLRIADDYFTTLNSGSIEDSIQLQGLFDYNKDVLKQEVKAELNKHVAKIKTALEQDPDRRVVVAGHTCDIGSYDYNKDLSARRAASVEKYLIQGGVSADKIHSEGHSYGQPIAPNTSEENRAKNRRVEINAYTVLQTDTYPSREGIGSLERFRNTSVQNSLKVDEKELEMALQATDIALGILAVVPATAPLAAAIALAKAGTSAIVSLGAALDECVFGNVMTHYINDLKRQNQMTRESQANQMMLNEICRNRKSAQNIPNHELWAAHFRLRAEAVAGLVGILMRASIGASNEPGDTYLDRLKKYHVQAYIENFLLNDQWVYPINVLNVLRMDSYWLFAVNDIGRNYDQLGADARKLSFGLDEQAKLTPSKVRETLKQKAVERLKQAEPHTPAYGSAYGGGYMMTYAPPAKDHLTSEYQSYFPIHHLATDKLSSFCENFDPLLSQYDESNYIYAAIYYRDPTEEDAEWEVYSDTRYKVKNGRNTLYKYKKLSPQHHIRVIVVFDEKMANIAPLSFQVNRVDGITSVNGPVYKELAKPLNEDELLDHEKLHFTGKIGCVFYPFYQFWDKTYLGLKPLSSDTKMLWYSNALEYYKRGELSNMRYQITCIVGENEDTKIDVPLGKKAYDPSEGKLDVSTFFSPVPDTLHIGLDTKTYPEQQHMLVKDFLVSETKEFVFPEMFKGNKDVRALVKINVDQPFIGPRNSFLSHLSEAEEKAIESSYNPYYLSIESNRITVDRFNWYSPVSFAFVASCTELNVDNYVKAKKDWARCIEYEVDMYEDSDTFSLSTDTQGPKLRGQLLYLGKLTRSTFKGRIYGVLKSDITYDYAGVPEETLEQLGDLVAILKAEGDEARSLVTWDLPQKNSEQVRYVFASIYQCRYRTPKGKDFDALRPFGKGIIGDGDDYFEFYFKDFKTSGTSGLNVDEVEGASGSKLTLRFHTPPDLKSGVPWCEPQKASDIEHLKDLLSDHQYKQMTTPGLDEKTLKAFLEDEAKSLTFNPVEAFDRQ